MLRDDGYSTKPIRGLPLDGRPNVALIRDTDDGALDGDTAYDRAVGPMQFIPSTWKSVGVDGNGDGRRDPNNIFDAAYGAARYLCDGDADLRNADARGQAVRRYNNADEYVRVVLNLADMYETGAVARLPAIGLPPMEPTPPPRPSPGPPQPAPDRPSGPTPGSSGPSAPAPRPAPPGPVPSPAPNPAPPAPPRPAPNPATPAPTTTPSTMAPPPPTTTAPPATSPPATPPPPTTSSTTTPPTTAPEPAPSTTTSTTTTTVPVDPPPEPPATPEEPAAAVGWAPAMREVVVEILEGSAEAPAPTPPAEPPAPAAPPAAPAPAAPSETPEPARGHPRHRLHRKRRRRRSRRPRSGRPPSSWWPGRPATAWRSRPPPPTQRSASTTVRRVSPPVPTPAIAVGDEGSGSLSVRQPGDGERQAAAGLGDWALLAITAAVTLPILWMGYGTDIDVGDVLESAELIRRFDYAPSRNPGVPVFESIVAVLDPIAGHLAINLATATAAGLAVVGLARLVRAWNHPNGDLVGMAFLASPVVLIAATSTGDFIWAAMFFVWGALLHLRGRSLAAGVLFSLAIGSRMTTIFIVAAFLIADGWEPVNRRRCVRSLLVAAPLAVLMYVPSWLAFDRTFEFLNYGQGYRGFANHLGRFLYKNFVVAGPVFIGLVAAAAPAMLASLKRWGREPLVRFSLLAFVATQALFLQFPWKGVHLLPAVMALVLWIAATTRNTRPFLWALVAAGVINGLVAFRPLAPDRPDNSRGARWEPTLQPGLVLNDIDCRLDFMGEEPHIDNGAWDCTLKPLRGPTRGGAGVATAES